MPTKVIDVRKARTQGDLRDVVHRAVQALVENQLVAFPTETVYGLAATALDAGAVTQLAAVKGRTAGHPFSLAVKSLDDALDYAPDMPPLAQRMARRCWPGPLTLVVDATNPDSLSRQLPQAVRDLVCPQGTIGFRVPASPLLLEVLRLLAGPLVLTSANRSGQPDPVAAEEVAAALGDDAALILDDGRCQFGHSSTVVKVCENQVQILREGVISAANIARLAGLMVLFVCTGNTCRSPMAELLCRKLLAERLGCKLDEVEDRGVLITSAGIAAMAGSRASPEAVEVMSEQGLDLTTHTSQPLHEQLVRHADVILTMTHSHRDALIAQWPQAASRAHVLSKNGQDVADPIGGPKEYYVRCAQQIEEMLELRLDELDLPTGGSCEES